MDFLYDYFHGLLERIKYGKWQLLLLPILFSVIGIYIEISTLNATSIPFENIAIKNALIPLMFFVVGFFVSVSLWRRYIWRFSANEKFLWNKDGFSFAFVLFTLAVLLQISAIWVDAGWDKVYVSELRGYYTEAELKSKGGYKNEIVMLKRQLTIAGVTFQVGEIVKVFFMIFVAKLLTDMKIWGRGQIRLNGKFFILPLLAILPVGVLAFCMPNYSMVMIFVLILFFMILIQEMELKSRLPLLALVALPILAVFFISNLDKDNSLVKVHGINRVWAYFQEGGIGNEQQNEALQAMADGGIVGKGLDKGTIKLRLFGARNDFAYSILGEELGMWLLLPITLAMFGFLFSCFWVAARIKVNNRDAMLAQNIAWGVGIIFALNILFHIGVNLRLLPNTGQPLSFVSSGGANLTMNFFLMGMLVQISSFSKEEPE
ncbi:MAG: FtsW/RodA/SpoVE family cell cycle protein [Fibromonadales bacterium]|nr:FtsW/RodA/SpoVE family cell cycle protein [Fibromonadales bacterium]